MKKQIKAHEERNVKSSAPAEPSSTPLPQYLLDRSQPTNAKALSSAIKNKRAEKAAKFSVPLPKVRGIAEEEMFKVVKTGKKIAKKGWERMITKPTFGVLYSFLRERSHMETHLLMIRSGTGLYSTACQIRAFHSTNGFMVQESQRYPPRAQRYGSASYHICQEKSSEPYVHPARCVDQRYNHQLM